MPFPQIRTTVLRICLLGGLVVYVGLYNWLYKNWLAPTFDYMGLSYHAPSALMMALGWFLALLPGLWMPLGLSRPSQIPIWFIYLMVYIPSMFNPTYMALQPQHELIGLMCALASGMMILSFVGLLPPIPLNFSFMSRGFFWSAVAFTTLALDIWVIAIFHSRMHLVSFADVYDLRSQADEISAGSGVGYGLMILSSVFDPLFMAYGLVSRKKWIVLIGFLNQVLLYAAGGSKAVMLSLVIVGGLYLILGKSGRGFGLRIVATVCVVLAVLCILAGRSDLNIVLQFALSLFFMRIFANGGYVTGSYSNFFRSHPLAYLSSVHGIDRFVHYPYDRTLGLVMGQYEMGISDLDLNGHFWASDGIAGFGLGGIVFISIICALVLWILDSSSAKHEPILGALLVAFVTVNLTNVSLFTTLVSGGLGLVIMILLFMPSTKSKGMIDSEISA